MKRFRLLICALLALLLGAFSIMPSFAAGALRASVSSATGSHGQTVTLTVSVTENPGIAGMTLGLSYDTQKIKLVSAAVGSFAGTTLPDPNSNNQRIVVVSTSNVKTTGAVASLTFEILSDASGSVAVSVRNFGVIDENMASVDFSASAGKITITTATVSSAPAVSSKPAESSAPAASSKPEVSSTPVSSSKPTVSSKPAVSSAPATSSKPVSSAVLSSEVSSGSESSALSSAVSQPVAVVTSSQTATSQPQSSEIAANADADPDRGNAAPMTAIVVMGVLALAFVGGAVYFGFFRRAKINEE